MYRGTEVYYAGRAFNYMALYMYMHDRKRGHGPYKYTRTHSKKLSDKIFPYTHMPSTGWRRPIGSPKLQIIFHKRATKYRSLLRKMTYKDKGSYGSSPPCIGNTP